MAKKKARSAGFTKKIEKAIIGEIKRLLASRRPVRKAAKEAVGKSVEPRRKMTRKLVARASRKVVQLTAGRIAKSSSTRRKRAR